MSYFYDHFDKYALNVAKKLGYSKADYIKSGDNGCAYDIGDDKVLKLTTDRNEAKNANKLRQKPITKHIVNYYDVREFKINEVESGGLENSNGMTHHVYAIVMDKVTPILEKYGYTKDTRVWYSIKPCFFNPEYSDQDIREGFFGEEQSGKDMINMFLSQRKSMLNEFKKYHIITKDFHLGNMGVDGEGNIVFFDIGAYSPHRTFGKKLKDIDLRESMFKPRNMDRWEKWNSDQPEVDGVRINQYDSEGRKQGKWIEYYDNGSIFNIENYKNDKLNGPWILYHSNGSLNVVGGYIDGLRDGVWQYYRKYGEPTVYSIYKRGIKVVDTGSGEYKHKNSLVENDKYETTDEYPEQHMVEQYLSLEDVKKIANSLGYRLKEKIGEGCYGCAYKLSDDKVLKLTFDYEEATNANYMRRKPITKHIVNYYDVRKINIPKFILHDPNIYSIVMDYVNQPADEIKDVFSKMRVKFFNDDISNEDILKGWGIRKLDWSRDEIPVVKYLLSQRDGVLKEMKKYKMSTIDLHKNNFGFKHNNLVFFDIGGDTKVYSFGKKLKPIVVENKNLFKPRNLGPRYSKWNEEQAIVDGIRINQYDSEGRKEGYWEENWPNTNKLNCKGKYVDNIKEGDWIFFHSDGSVWYEEEFKNGETGNKTIIYYYEDDVIESKRLYVNDKFVKNLNI